MVFFNYSTMQVAAKIVYYGPGLCGKTTNLQYIYDHTTNDSRGEMVSLQTETDRTLFFDLLPIDLGSIGGFKTKIQLYTVPGQVFYNTTRKLVLKGVDGVVYVADSQRLMLDANVDSMANLEANLAEIGFKITDLPVVIQYNKRDLPDVSPLSELEAALNKHGLPSFEACALSGQGVFETLTGIAKLTLASLRDRLTAGKTAPRPSAPAIAPRTSVAGIAPRPRGTAVPPLAAPRPPLTSPAPAGTAAPRPGPVLGGPRPSSPLGAPVLRGGPAVTTAPAVAAVEAPPAVEKPPASGNGHVQMNRDLALAVPRADLARARRVSVQLRLEDGERNVVGDLEQDYDLAAHPSLEELLLRLQVSVTPRDEPGG
jgi:signal recognition particle receptor subunit beta